MFTGIIEQTGQLVERIERPFGYTFVIETPAPLTDVKPGDSIAIDGVCLTVTPNSTHQRLAFDVGPETIALTTLPHYQVGRTVHLEKAMALGARLGGHLLQGHVEGIGVLTALSFDKGAMHMRISLPQNLLRLCIPKGSIALDGVSLTINAIANGAIEVCLIPHTLTMTHFSQKSVGDTVNIETDMMGKYVFHYLQGLQHHAAS